ncbi:MAG: ApaLI family restriction endonuclease, partial [Lachnospiraceae bacterium]|nr:ApaLI family restriction endonuclease [Lachnospiraceae bacterium]
MYCLIFNGHGTVGGQRWQAGGRKGECKRRICFLGADGGISAKGVSPKRYNSTIGLKNTRSENSCFHEIILIYRVLGVTNEDGNLIDLYQNKGRFLYKYAGAFLEEAACMCIKHKYSEAAKVKIPNTLGSRPKTFEIDCLVNGMAHEIKWRDATTDGDHITKEHTRVKVIKEKGYT